MEGSVPVLQYDKITDCRLRTAERTHVILHVWSAAVEEEDPTGLVVAALTTQVESCEAAPVLHVDIGLGLAQTAHCSAEPLPGGLVEGRVAVQLVLVVQAGALLDQHLHHLEVAAACRSLQGRVTSLQHQSVSNFKPQTSNYKLTKSCTLASQPRSSNASTVSSWPDVAATWRTVSPSCKYYFILDNISIYSYNWTYQSFGYPIYIDRI